MKKSQLRKIIREVIAEREDVQRDDFMNNGPTPNPDYMNAPQGVGTPPSMHPSKGPKRAAGGSNPCTEADVMKALGNPKNMTQAMQGYQRIYSKHGGVCADGKPLPRPQSIKQKYPHRPNDPVEPKFVIWIMTAIFCIGTYCLTGGYGTWEE